MDGLFFGMYNVNYKLYLDISLDLNMLYTPNNSVLFWFGYVYYFVTCGRRYAGTLVYWKIITSHSPVDIA